MKKLETYDGREQSLIKHQILEKYLQLLAFKIGTFAPSITYIDGFSGPWESRAEDLSDTSFSIALSVLKQTQEELKALGFNIRLRFCFIEKDRKSFQRLDDFAKSQTGIEIKTIHKDFESAIPDVVSFVGNCPGTFPFILLDPTGWTGFGMKHLGPLLRLRPCEVLINFMTGHIRRFIDAPDSQTKDSIIDLFGSEDYIDKIRNAKGIHREHIAVTEYTRNAKRVGAYPYGCNAIVLNPKIDRTHFHLVYLTRHTKGVDVFKGIENKVMLEQQPLRDRAKQRDREAKSNQPELFDAAELPDERHFRDLKRYYLDTAKEAITNSIQQSTGVSYADLHYSALALPLVQESDIRLWISEFEEKGQIRVEGVPPRKRSWKGDVGQQIIIMKST